VTKQYDNTNRGSSPSPFEHYCAVCGNWGAFGYGVSLQNDKPGIWYCFEHRPQLSTTSAEAEVGDAA
jgi:hypothetical protein